MGDGPRGIEVFPDYFQASSSDVDTPQSQSSSIPHHVIEFEHSSSNGLWNRRKLKTMLNLLSLRRISWGSGTDAQEKVVLSATEVQSLRSEVADLEEREAYLKAQLEHLDEILRYGRMSSYLYMRPRWAALPGEEPPIDDVEVDDWLPRFVVLHGACLFFYLLSTDLSPQDSTLLADIIEVAPMPCFTQEGSDTRYYFYILTRHGLRYECSSASKVQVDAWLSMLQDACKLGSGLSIPDPSTET